MSAESAVMDGRSAAEALMVDACVITGDGVEPVWDEDAGEWSTPEGAAVYEGMCQVQVPNVSEQNVNAGEREWTVQPVIVKLPVVGSEAVAIGHTVRITLATLDARLEGSVYTVTANHAKSHATARRLRCKEVPA